MMEVLDLGNMTYNASLEYNSSPKAARHQPGKIDRGIDTDRGESISIVITRRKVLLSDLSELKMQ